MWYWLACSVRIVCERIVLWRADTVHCHCFFPLLASGWYHCKVCLIFFYIIIIIVVYLFRPTNTSAVTYVNKHMAWSYTLFINEMMNRDPCRYDQDEYLQPFSWIINVKVIENSANKTPSLICLHCSEMIATVSSALHRMQWQRQEFIFWGYNPGGLADGSPSPVGSRAKPQ